MLKLLKQLSTFYKEVFSPKLHLSHKESVTGQMLQSLIQTLIHTMQDRTVITNSDAERVDVSPPGLQDAINCLVAQTGDQVGVETITR
jgi:hypothetical protein